jgi:HlyD family secretion protein
LKKIAILLFIITILVIFFIYYLKPFHVEKARELIDVSGTIEATEVDLTSKVPGRIQWLCCREGDYVKAGEVSVRIDDMELKARVEEGMASIDLASASLKIVEGELKNANLRVEAARDELMAQESEVERLITLTEDAKINLERARKLFESRTISQKDLDDARTNYEANHAMLASVRARKKVFDIKLETSIVDLNLAESRQSYARAQVSEAQARLKVFKAQLADMEIPSPINGVIFYKSFEAGEIVSPGASIYTVHDLNDIWALAEIEESKIGIIKLGAMARVTATSIPDREFGGELPYMA